MPNAPCSHKGPRCTHPAEKWPIMKARAIEVHDGKYGYDLITAYGHNRQILPIVCPIHGRFEQQFQMHLGGAGCQECAREKSSLNRPPMRTLNLVDVIRRCTEIHGSYYDYSLVTTYVRGTAKVTIICPIHGPFKQSFLKHLTGQGCTPCNRARRDRGNTMPLSELIERGNERYGNRFDYSRSVLVNAKTPITIICPTHGEFKQLPWAHLNSHMGCGQCGRELASANKTRTQAEFEQEANAKHNGFYLYDEAIYTKSSQKLFIKCPKHGGFWQVAESHLMGTGCDDCGTERTADGQRYTKEEWIDVASKVHKITYDYATSVYVNCNTKVLIVCPTHGEFQTTPMQHIQGVGCRECTGKYTSSSAGERLWLNLLGLPDDAAHRLVKVELEDRYCRVDGFDPTTNTVYEYNGSFWHGDLRCFERDALNERVKKTFGELYDRTIRREEQLRAAGYTVIVMWELDFRRAMRVYNRELRREIKAGRTLPDSTILTEFYPQVMAIPSE